MQRDGKEKERKHFPDAIADAETNTDSYTGADGHTDTGASVTEKSICWSD